MRSDKPECRRTTEPRPSFAGIRRYNRRSIDVKVLVQDANGWEIPLEGVDLSPVGMFVRSPFLFDVGDYHTLIFRDPEGEELFRISGRVVRVQDDEKADGTGPGMGYEFVDPDRETWTKLCALVSRA